VSDYPDRCLVWHGLLLRPNRNCSLAVLRCCIRGPSLGPSSTGPGIGMVRAKNALCVVCD
jgi:hypothetical protein